MNQALAAIDTNACCTKLCRQNAAILEACTKDIGPEKRARGESQPTIDSLSGDKPSFFAVDCNCRCGGYGYPFRTTTYIPEQC
ncbi:MAG TPA: hypothetical protein VHM20_05470 [Gammaproteobacteria bacterium]|nr:hypothetical protein [Gammaproteobacteria bacterium]